MTKSLDQFQMKNFEWKENPLIIACDKMESGQALTRFNASRDDSFLIHDPELIKQVFIREARHFTEEKHPYYNLKSVVPETGQEILKLKSGLDSNSIYKTLNKMIDDSFSALKSSLEAKSGGFDIYADIGEYAADVTLRTLFGIENSEWAKEMFTHSSEVEECLALQRRAVDSQDQELSERHEMARNKMKGVLRKVFTQCLESQSVPIAHFMKNHDFDAPVPLTLTRTFLNAFAGVATTMTWMIMVLGEQQELQKEIHNGIDKEGDVNPLLKALSLETLRLYPTAWMMTRTSNRDQSLNEQLLKAGDEIHVCMYSLHRDPKFWDNPLTFNHKRFLDSDTGSAKHPFAFLPFGLGPHRCVGAKFAQHLIESTLKRFLTHFSVAPQSLKEIEAFPFVALRPVPGAHVTLERRNP